MCTFEEHGGDTRFLERLSEIADLHSRKQHDYGADADPFANLRASLDFGIQPWVGAMVRLNDKVTRVKSLIAKGSLENESVRDSFRDIAVYALIADILYCEEAGVEQETQALTPVSRGLAAFLTSGNQRRTE